MENWTLRDLGTGYSLAAEEAVRCGDRGRELLGEGRVAMMRRKEVEHKWRGWVLIKRLIGVACLTCSWVNGRCRDLLPRIRRTLADYLSFVSFLLSGMNIYLLILTGIY